MNTYLNLYFKHGIEHYAVFNINNHVKDITCKSSKIKYEYLFFNSFCSMHVILHAIYFLSFF